MPNLLNATFNGTRRAHPSASNVPVAAVVLPFRRVHDAAMTKAHTGPTAGPSATTAPRCNVRRLREALGYSQRELAARCRPELAPTTITRIERNAGYTLDTLERLAVALHTTVEALLLPPELAQWATLRPEQRERVLRYIDDIAIAERFRRDNTG